MAIRKLKLKEVRVARGLSQVELAARSSIQQSELSRWERGLAIPPPNRLISLARALGCAPADLVEFD